MKNKKDLIKLQKRAAIMASAIILLTSLSGCKEEMGADISNLDLLITNTDENGNSLNRGVTQTIPVNGENFKLIVNYLSGSKEWRITDNKKLFVEIKTEDLADNLCVYIDNIHIDTSIVSTKAGFDGIKQDTMDDHIHNSLMYGFPIDNSHSYFGVNEIEGQNDTFIKGYAYGNAYYTSGSLEEKRYLESDYLEDGVWANKIDTVIDLLIVDKQTNEVLRQVSVDSSLLVEVNDKIIYSDGSFDYIYDYEKDGSRTLVRKIEKNN